MTWQQLARRPGDLHGECHVCRRAVHTVASSNLWEHDDTGVESHEVVVAGPATMGVPSLVGVW